MYVICKYTCRDAIRHAFNVLAVRGPKHRVSVCTCTYVYVYVCVCVYMRVCAYVHMC